MDVRRIVATMYDGTKHEAQGVHGGLADRVAYEAEFDEAVFAQQQRVTRSVTPDGELTEDADPNAFSDRKLSFFPWCILRRSGCAVGSFADFLEGCEELIVERLPDPTAPAPPSEL